MLAWKKFPYTRQLDARDCGPSCLKMIAKHHGNNVSLQFLRDQCGLSKEGVSLYDLSVAADKISLRSAASFCTLHQLQKEAPLPCIIHWNEKHFVVVYDASDKFIMIADPARGLIKYTAGEFTENWLLTGKNTGIILCIEPQANFHEWTEEDGAQSLKSLHSFMQYLKPYKKQIGQMMLIMLIVTAMQSCLPFLSRSIIDVGVRTQDKGFITLMLLANITLILSIALGNMARDWVVKHVSGRFNAALVSDYLGKLMKLPVSFFESKHTGDMLQRAHDHDRIKNFIMNSCTGIVFAVLTFTVFGTILFFFHHALFWIFIIGTSLYIAWAAIMQRLQEKFDWKAFSLQSRNSTYWVETLHNITDIKANGYGTTRRWKWERLQVRIHKTNMKAHSLQQLQEIGSQLINGLKNIFLTYYCANAVIEGEMTLGTMISTQFILGYLNTPISQSIGFMQSLQAARLSFKRFSEIEQFPDEQKLSGSNTLQAIQNRDITLRNVYFSYKANQDPALRNLNLKIPEGQITAIVGESGCGKSTLLKLLLRIYQPSSGVLQIGAMQVKNIDIDEWRNACGVVLHESKLFNDTVLSNIVLKEEAVDYNRLKHTIKITALEKVIEELPNGYHTMVGENGLGLSQGQKQRLLLARALYKNPDIVVLDEATNALDAINERSILQHLESELSGKTVIIAAHRLSTIRNAHQIIVMHQGMIIEQGDHVALMKKGGAYHKLIQSQYGEMLEQVLT
jgi:ATP-binding cassette subfamily B protein